MSWLLGRRVSRMVLVFVFCLAFLLGVGLAHSGHLLGGAWCLAGLAGFVTTMKRRNVWTLLWIVMFGLCLGWWRGSLYMIKLAEYDHYFYHKVTISARASDDAAYNQNKQLSFDTHNATIVETGQKLTGKVGISVLGAPAVFAGDEVTVTGKLYPSRGSYQAKISYASIVITAHGHSVIDNLRRRFVSGMQSALPEPLASFGMGLLIGQKANLSDDVYQSLLMVGLVHIIAVSGYNLTIILRASKGLLSKHSKRMSTLLAFALIGIFLLFAGSSASIVRAAIVSVLSIGAVYYGRNVRPLVLIMLAAAITAWANPFYVWTDVSWYLSFLAFFGVMVVAPMVMQRLRSVRLQNSLVITVAVESLCAEIMTLPYVLHIFGQMSFVTLLANVLVVALTPLAMLLCLVAGLAGMLVPAVAGWLAWPARLVLTYMLDIAGLLSRIPHVFAEGLSLPLTQLLFLYAVLGFVVYLLWGKTKRATITDKETTES